MVPLIPGWPGRGAPWRKLAHTWASGALHDLVERLQPDVIHAHFVSSAGLLAVLAGSRPLAITAHGSDLMGSPQWVRHCIARYVGRRADLVNPVSHELENILRAQGIPAARILRLSLGVDLELIPFAPRLETTQPPRLLCTRHLETVYDPLTLVRAVALLRDEGHLVHLTLAGGGALFAQVKDLVRQLGLEEHVECLGGFEPTQLASLMAQSDFYVSASHRDGTSVSLLEAMAAGVYPVVSDIPANRPWLEPPNGHGELFAPGNAQALADAVIRALHNPDRADMLERNRERVRAEGDRTKSLTILATRLEQLASQESP